MVAFFVVFLLFVGKGWTLDWKMVKPIARLSHDPYNPESIGSNAVDGIIPSNTSGSGWRKCAVSKGWSNPEALTIVLRRDYWISSVKVHLRETSRAKWQNGLRIYIGNQLGNDKQFTQCGGMYTYRGHSHPVFKCDPPLQGKLIHLIKFPNQFPYVGIQVCEVEVRAGFPCHHLPDNFEVINSTGSHYHDTAYAKCTTGYHQKPQLFKCESNRQWEPMESLVPCKPVDCRKPSAPINGYIEGRNFQFKSKVNYTCNDGCRREGAGEAQCMANGSWSSSPPLCKQLTCSSLKPLKNGRSIVGGTTIGSNVTVFCNPGYGIKMKGQNEPTEMTFECKQFSTQNDATAEWTQTQSGRLPLASLECQAKNCSNLPDIQQGKIFYKPSTLYGSKARYECKDDYEMKDGDGVRFCKEDGKWNGTEPKCTKVVLCGKRHILPGHFVIINSTGVNIGDIAFYQCGKHHLPKIPQKFRCESDGQWKPTGKLIPCTALDCGRPTDPAFGYHKKLSRDYEFGSKVKFYCYFGYKLSSDVVRFCGSSGKWQPSPPKCIAMSCLKLPDIASGTIEVTGTQVNDTAQYRCNTGYKLLGSTYRMCLVLPLSEETFWTSSPPQCYSDPCELPLDPGPCKMNEIRWYYNETTSKCRQFEYSGCFGNENNFGSELRCVEKCVNQTVPTQQAVTSPPPVPKCCKIKKNRRKLCSENQFVVSAKILNVTKNKEGSQVYDIKTIHSIKGKRTVIASKGLKIVRNGDCSNVICPPLKIKQKYLIGFQMHKNSKLILNDKDYIEEIGQEFVDSKFSCRKHQ